MVNLNSSSLPYEQIASKEAEGKRDEALAYLDRVKASGAGAGQVRS